MLETSLQVHRCSEFNLLPGLLQGPTGKVWFLLELIS